MIVLTLDRLESISVNRLLRTIRVDVFHPMYRRNETSIPIDEIYPNVIVASAVSLQAVERMPLWLIYISFVFHTDERFEIEL